MNMKFYRKLPIPQDVKAEYPVTPEMAEIKQKRDSEIRDVFRKEQFARLDAYLLAGALFVAHVDLAGWVVARQQHRQTGNDAVLAQGLGPRLQLRADLRRNLFTVQDRCHGCIPPNR